MTTSTAVEAIPDEVRTLAENICADTSGCVNNREVILVAKGIMADRALNAPDGGEVEPVAWEWDQLMHDSMGGWEHKIERYCPSIAKPEDVRNIRPLYTHPLASPEQGDLVPVEQPRNAPDTGGAGSVVERLRDFAEHLDPVSTDYRDEIITLRAAADLIQNQAAAIAEREERIESLEKALREIAATSSGYTRFYCVEIARAALQQEGE